LSEFNKLQKSIVSIKCTDLDNETASWLVKNRPLGVILFKENIKNRNQLKNLIKDIKSLYSPSPLFSVDFEGGKVNRLSEITGKLHPPLKQKDLKEYGKFSGGLLKSLGIDINFAPVVDINFGVKGNGLDDRYLGESVEQVVENAEKYLEGIESQGITACLKHYPGLGKIKPDTHFSISKVKTVEGLQEIPFKLLSTEKRLIMVAHLYIESFSEITTYSKQVIERIKSFHKGKIITDDLSMKALPENDDYEKIKKAYDAGFDIALIRFDNPIFRK
jgi:beta-N-acetylhexosaminidase